MLAERTTRVLRLGAASRMRTFEEEMMRSIVAIAAVAAFAGCANRAPLPLAQTVCVTAPQETPQETAYVRRKVAEYLERYYFTLADEGAQCDVKITYEPFGKFQGESIRAGFFAVQRDGYWSQEGIVSATHKGAEVVKDQAVNLRGYKAKQYLMDDLAWQIVAPATGYFQAANTPPPTPKK